METRILDVQRTRKEELIAKRANFTRVAIRAVEADLDRAKGESERLGLEIKRLQDKRDDIVRQYDAQISQVVDEQNEVEKTVQLLMDDLKDFETIDMDLLKLKN